MRDILEGIAAEARQLGADADVVDDVFVPDRDTAHLVIPHEFYATTDPSEWPSRQILSRTIALGVEHPGTGSFEVSATQSQRCAAIVDINADSIEELGRRGVTAQPFPLGYTSFWDHWGEADSARDIDIAYLGSTDPRRDKALAGFAPLFWDRTSRIYVPTPDPQPGEQEHYVVGKRKLELLANTKVLINMHRMASSAFEWVRVIEAISNGCVVVSEHSADHEPLVPQEHFLSGDISTLGLLTVGLLEDPEALQSMRTSAYRYLRDELPLRPSVERLLNLAEDLVRSPRPARAVAAVPEAVRYTPPAPGWSETVAQADYLGAAIRRLESQLVNQQRMITRLTLGLSDSDDADVEVCRTPTFDQVSPKISVTVTCHNYSAEVVTALESVYGTGSTDIEVLIYDDASTDRSVAVIRDYLRSRPDLPAKLVRGRVNKGPSAARNDLIASARGEYVFILDADNGIYPTALERLAAALDDDPDAAFSYCVIAAVRGDKPERLVSAQPWRPSRLRQGNYIDAMAMLRRSDVIDVGGYDPKMPQWEDFHLWARMAESGRRGAFVPEILAWYRLSHHSNSMGAAVDSLALWSRIRQAAPSIMHD